VGLGSLLLEGRCFRGVVGVATSGFTRGNDFLTLLLGGGGALPSEFYGNIFASK